MKVTKHFRESIRDRAQQEPAFRDALLREAAELTVPGDEKTGRAIIRNYINDRLDQATAFPASKAE